MESDLLLVVTCVVTIATGAWGLLKRGAGDILGATTLFEIALLAAIGIELLLPNTFVLSSVAALSLGWKGAKRALENRYTAIERKVATSGSPAEGFISLQDRLDELDAPVPWPASHILGSVSSQFLAVLSVGLLLTGLGYDSWQFLLLGAGFSFPAFSGMARYFLESREAERVEESMRSLLPSGEADSVPRGELGGEGASVV